MPQIKHPEVVSSLHSKFEAAKTSGALIFYPSTRTRVKEEDINYEIIICPALQKMPSLPVPDLSKIDKLNDPFVPPYIPDLFLGELKDELGGDEYVVLLNKYSIIPGHFLMVTKEFQPQNSLLTSSDLTQAYLLIRASQNSGSPIFAYYNCGADSGASQPHKHIQFIPSTQIEIDGEEECSRPPVEDYVRGLKFKDETKPFALPLPYTHLVQKLLFPKATISGTKILPKEALEELSETLTRTFLNLLNEAAESIQLYYDAQSPATSSAEAGRATFFSYNVILTSEHMHLVPRIREKTVEELQTDGEEKIVDGAAGYTPRKLGVNSLGFAGVLLAESDREAQVIRARGVVELLAQVGVPRAEDESSDTSESMA